MLASPETAYRTAQNLADIANYFNFDGWFFNIECNVGNPPGDAASDIKNLELLLKYGHARGGGLCSCPAPLLQGP